MSAKPLLVAVPHDWKCVGPIVTRLVGNAFDRVVYGNNVDAIVSEKSSADPIVMLIGGGGTHDILKEVLSWRDAAGKQRVQWVHSYWTGVDAFQLDRIADAIGDTPITNARSVFAPMLAEHVLLSALYFNRYVAQLQLNRKNRVYDKFPSTPGADQVLGIIGYGDIGRHVAQSAIHGLHVNKVIGLKTRLVNGITKDDLGVNLVAGAEGLDEILTTADIVVAILPNTPQTKHMIRREHFQKMKPSSIFINIGRGATVVEDDLVNAIQAKEIRGAALDVFEVEPLPPTSRLWELDDSQLLLTPHNADISPHSYTDAVEDFAGYVANYAATGSIPPYRVDVRRGY